MVEMDRRAKPIIPGEAGDDGNERDRPEHERAPAHPSRGLQHENRHQQGDGEDRREKVGIGRGPASPGALPVEPVETEPLGKADRETEHAYRGKIVRFSAGFHLHHRGCTGSVRTLGHGSSPFDATSIRQNCDALWLDP